MQYFMSFSSPTVYFAGLVSLPLGFSLLVSITFENSCKIILIERATVKVINYTCGLACCWRNLLEVSVGSLVELLILSFKCPSFFNPTVSSPPNLFQPL